MPEGSCCDDEEHCGRQHFDPSIVFEVDLGASPATVEVVRAVTAGAVVGDTQV